jgi:integrase
MALSDSQIKKAKPTDKLQKLADGGGLQLHVAATGGKLWRLAYRFDGKQKTLALGAYPAVSLANARDARDTARKLLAAGADPMAQKKAVKLAKQAASEHSFETVARQWFDHWKSSKSLRHTVYVMARLEADVFPAIGSRPVAAVEAPELVRMLKTVEARGALDIAKRCLQMCSQVFRYAIAHGVGGTTRNPATDIKPADVLTPRKKENYARIDARELPALLRKIEGYQGTPPTRLAIKLMALTFVRTGELIGARWEEVDFDAARWNIPAARMKMKTPHIVPLSSQAVEVLQILHGVTGTRALLFPGERDHDKSMSNNTILKALERMGYKGQMTGHGFRGIASTILHEQGFDHAHIELQLAHQERNEVSAAYNHALYLKQRATMMQRWGDFLENQTRGNVVALRGLAA